MAVRDFIHDEQIIDAVIAQLNAELPSEWTSGEDPIWRLQRLDFGDLRDYRMAREMTWRDLCPAILIRVDRSERAAEYGGLGGKEGQVVPLRLLHVRARGQCRDLENPEKLISPARARAQCAKAISKALFANRDLGRPTLTTEDSSARVVELRPRAVVYEAEKGDVALAATYDLVAVAVDFDVVVRTQ
jgi:hypothetical protein